MVSVLLAITRTFLRLDNCYVSKEALIYSLAGRTMLLV
jgi:hypothetical protein